jgi:hypothetical protein
VKAGRTFLAAAAGLAVLVSCKKNAGSGGDTFLAKYEEKIASCERSIRPRMPELKAEIAPEHDVWVGWGKSDIKVTGIANVAGRWRVLLSIDGGAGEEHFVEDKIGIYTIRNVYEEKGLLYVDFEDPEGEMKKVRTGQSPR